MSLNLLRRDDGRLAYIYNHHTPIRGDRGDRAERRSHSNVWLQVTWRVITRHHWMPLQCCALAALCDELHYVIAAEPPAPALAIVGFDNDSQIKIAPSSQLCHCNCVLTLTRRDLRYGCYGSLIEKLVIQ
jgi:hypothetical protein